MQKNQRPWNVVATELRKKLDASDLNYCQLAEAAKIDYHAARRLHLGGLKNTSENAKSLCRFFGISLLKNAKMQNLSINELYASIENVWDGSQPHAELLIELINSTKLFEVKSKKIPP